MAGLFNDIKNKALNAALNIADSFTPVLKESKFRETGFITPEEFVTAGDFLVGHCPTWQWAHVSNPKACKDYLPKERQFLITKNVPCSKRCRHLMDSLKDNQEKVVEEETGDGGWVDTHFTQNSTSATSTSGYAANQGVDVIDADDDDASKMAKANKTNQQKPLLKHLNKNDDDDDELGKGKSKKANDDDEDEDIDDDNNDDDDDEEAVDMDEYDHNVRDDNNDETTVTKKNDSTANISNDNKLATTTTTTLTSISPAAADVDEDVFIPTRTYDLNITYDNYYRTPRLWLSGYDENNRPLTIEQMYDDISEDHAKKTVTFETHPHIPGTLMASIHPCRHAEVMKKLINLVADSGKDLEVHSYLMVFLKFVQSVIPTIEYDYTRNISI